jgi:tetratricopeptide (TPR) repeat protein
MKRLILFVSILGMITHAFAIDPLATIKEANDLYSKNQFEQAVKLYKSVCESSYASSELYFNLGNTYFKTNSIKEAILYYERAKLLNPGDKDIEYNLEMARSMTVDKINALPELFFITWIKWVRDLLSLGGWTMLCLTAFLLSLAAMLLYLLTGSIGMKKIGFWVGVFMLLISLTSFAMGMQLKHMQTANNTAIIFASPVTLKSAPAESGTNLFVLHEGTKVEILDKVGDWRWVRIADGNRGWIKMSDMVNI